MAKRQKPVGYVAFHMDRTLFTRVRALAKQEGIGVSTYCRRSVLRELQRLDAARPPEESTTQPAA